MNPEKRKRAQKLKEAIGKVVTRPEPDTKAPTKRVTEDTRTQELFKELERLQNEQTAVITMLHRRMVSDG